MTAVVIAALFDLDTTLQLYVCFCLQERMHRRAGVQMLVMEAAASTVLQQRRAPGFCWSN